MENLGKKNNFESTKVGFNKAQGKIKEKNYKKIKVIDQKKKENNASPWLRGCQGCKKYN